MAGRNGDIVGEADTYFGALISQGYLEKDALIYTQKHFPDFQLTLHDSVISGDVITTNTVSADADVIKAAMDGVIEAIKEIKKPDPGVPKETEPLPPVITPSLIEYPSPPSNLKPKGKNALKPILIGGIISFLMITSGIVYMLITNYSSYDTHRIEGSWYMKNEQITITFSQENENQGIWKLKGISNDSFVILGNWSIIDSSNTYGKITLSDEFPQDSTEFYYSINNDVLVMHEVSGNGNECNPMVKFESIIPNDSDFRQQVSASIQPDFCRYRDE